MEPDELDRRILDLLRGDGQLGHAEIGRRVGLTGPAIHARVRRLERAGVILGYGARISEEATGRPLLGFVRVTTRPLPKETETFEAYALAEPRIAECHDVDGEDSFVLKVRCASPEDLRALLVEIRALPTVVRTVSSIALVTVKEGRT